MLTCPLMYLVAVRTFDEETGEFKCANTGTKINIDFPES